MLITFGGIWMPILKPKVGEDDKTFMGRCMANKIMVSEYPDIKQRYAICNSQLKKPKPKKSNINVNNVKNKMDENMAKKKSKSVYGFKVVSKAKGKHIIAGYGSYIMIDSDDQLVTIEALKGGLTKFMADKERRNIMISHEGIQIGKVLETYKDYKTLVDDKGLFIVAEIYDDLETSKGTWQGILDGEYNAFSISFEPLEKATHVVDGVWEEVKQINLLEVSVCQNPKNPLSRFIILSKSSNVKEINNGEKMTEEELKSKPKQDPEEEPEGEPAEKPKKPVRMPFGKPTDESEDGEKSPGDNKEDDAGGLVGAIRGELQRLSGLGEEIHAEDLSPLAKLVTNLRTGGQKAYRFPEKAVKSEEDDWHTVVANAIDDIYNRLDVAIPAKAETKSNEAVKKLKAEVVKKSQEAEEAKKDAGEAKKDAEEAKGDAVAAKQTAEEVKTVANQDREIMSELKDSLKNVNETFGKFEERLKNLESQKEVKTKVTTEKLIEDYHPSNVRESPDGVEIIINGEE